MTSSHPTPAPCQWFDRLAVLDRRSAPRFARLFLGAMLALGRRKEQINEKRLGLAFPHF